MIFFFFTAVAVLRTDKRTGRQNALASIFLVAVRGAQARLPRGVAVLPGQYRAGGTHLVVRGKASPPPPPIFSEANVS